MSQLASDAPVTTRRSRPLKASDVLANDLRARILEENLRPGSSLPSETELIHDYSYSRGTVREALRLLESEGFIQIQRGPKGGISVRHPDFNLVSRSMATLMVIGETPLVELFEFRKLVEPAAAKDVALHADDAQRQALTEYMKSAPSAHGGAGFHRLLGDCVGNDILRVTLTSLNRIIEWHMGFEQLSPISVEEGRPSPRARRVGDRGWRRRCGRAADAVPHQGVRAGDGETWQAPGADAAAPLLERAAAPGAGVRAGVQITDGSLRVVPEMTPRCGLANGHG